MFPASGRRAGSDLRASDAERHEVGDALGRHFAEGRLDQAEFSRRLDRAMGAVTRGQLDALFQDLPPLDGAARATGRRGGRLLTLVLLVVVAALTVGPITGDLHLPVVVLVLAAVWLWHRARWRGRTDTAAVGPGR